MGYTIGLPPGYYLDDSNIGAQVLKETFRSIWSDLNSGPSSSDETIMFEDNLYNIYIRGFPEDYSAQMIHDELELNMKKLVPGYQGNGIRSIQVVRQKKVCVIKFFNEDTFQMFRNQLDNFVIGGRIVLCASWYSEPEVPHNFGESARVFLGNVIIHGDVDLTKLKRNFPNIMNINQQPNNITIITFHTYDEALYFVLSTKKKYDAAILNFPFPQAEVCKKSNLPPNCVTTLEIPAVNKGEADKSRKKKDNSKSSELKLSMVFDPDVNLAKPIDPDVLPSCQLKNLNIYNVVKKYLLDDDSQIAIISKDMLEYGESFGKVENIEIKPPKYDFESYAIITIKFKTPAAAQNCQKDIAGRFYLGNIVITQLS